jgi:hypothetical protein
MYSYSYNVFTLSGSSVSACMHYMILAISTTVRGTACVVNAYAVSACTSVYMTGISGISSSSSTSNSIHCSVPGHTTQYSVTHKRSQSHCKAARLGFYVRTAPAVAFRSDAYTFQFVVRCSEQRFQNISSTMLTATKTLAYQQ